MEWIGLENTNVQSYEYDSDYIIGSVRVHVVPTPTTTTTTTHTWLKYGQHAALDLDQLNRIQGRTHRLAHKQDSLNSWHASSSLPPQTKGGALPLVCLSKRRSDTY
ncbi:hypothetical protein E2C01_047380 [Portunus trituberculatus]|uniref:Uncharacterized protein n=1 Tax=Portunus trituberculatus TaxID=210409 RepID=A0A5B7G7L0_PORTR|nr:hypothetical protein [Portunus trituberculatus]